jgi:hypothetical protein
VEFDNPTILRQSQLSPRLSRERFRCHGARQWHHRRGKPHDIVADLTDTLLREIRDLNLKITPDGEGRFGYINDGGVYIEIIPYGKLLQDAKLRQGIFFQKLGLTNLDPTAVAEGEALDKVAAPEMSEEIGA